MSEEAWDAVAYYERGILRLAERYGAENLPDTAAAAHSGDSREQVDVALAVVEANICLDMSAQAHCRLAEGMHELQASYGEDLPPLHVCGLHDLTAQQVEDLLAHFRRRIEGGWYSIKLRGLGYVDGDSGWELDRDESGRPE